MVRIASSSEVLAAVASARDVDVLAYTLRRGPVLAALEAAARRGAHVKVRLEGTPFNDSSGSLARENARIAAELAAAGADAGLAHAGPDAAAQRPVHAKTLIADGRLYLDDRNWGSSDFVAFDDDPNDVARVRAAAAGTPDLPPDPAFAIEKRPALAAEAALVRGGRPGDDAIVESESFGYGNPVYSALDALAKSGRAPRLLVSSREARGSRERSALTRLSNDGARVRVCDDSEKFALVGGTAWIGSANASPAFGKPDTIDWGLVSADAGIVDAVRARIEARWSSAKPFSPTPTHPVAVR